MVFSVFSAASCPSSCLHWRTHQVLLSPSFSIMLSHVLPYLYALISSSKTFSLLKPDGFVPLSCSYLVLEDAGQQLLEKTHGTSGGLSELWTATSHAPLLDRILTLAQSTSVSDHLDSLWDELLWQAGCLLKKKLKKKIINN